MTNLKRTQLAAAFIAAMAINSPLLANAKIASSDPQIDTPPDTVQPALSSPTDDEGEGLQPSDNQESITLKIDGTRVKAYAFYRYWNSRIGDHFYTTNYQELGSGNSGYVAEGIQSYIPSEQYKGTVPLYRYWNSRIGDHFYTTNYQELGSGQSGYVLEGIAGYIYPNRYKGTIPLYRYWNSRIGDHFYTTNYQELGSGRSGYVLEGIAGYVLTK
jgi:hypothetical protein